MTGSFEAGHAARRALHRDHPGREGLEAELVQRLIGDVTPAAARRALARCLEGEITPPAALLRLLVACGGVGAVRELVDDVTARVDEDSRAGDALVRDRADALTRLFLENAAACARTVALAERGDERAGALLDAAGADDGEPVVDAARRDEERFAAIVAIGCAGT